MSLRDLTHEAHQNAERQKFVKVLFSGSIDPKLYATYLKNQHPQYEILEVCAMIPSQCPVVAKYIEHIMSIKDDPKKLMAHIYVRHMGDLAGGQMIAKKVPGEGRMYQFEDPDGLKTAIRAKIDDDMADEAKVCFEFATQFFKEMMDFVDE
jgi:heme oxygenase